MHIRSIVLALLMASPLALAQQVVGDEACPLFAVDIESFATCEGDRVTRPVPTSDLDSVSLPEDHVPAAKRAARALYLSAAQADHLRRSRPGELILLDIRTLAEVVVGGQPEGVDAHVPLLVELAPPPDGNTDENAWRLQRNPSFVADVERALAHRGVGKDSRVMVLSRCGDLGSIAADALGAAGFSRVYTVIDGFDGDIGSSGARDVNGWKNAGAPWRARPDARLLYSARR
jgi:rhodanese-related sulfurtransferase